MNTTEGNKLIAEFMRLDILHGDMVRHESASKPNFVTKMKYHTSWDWLMPVVTKIESLGYVVTIKGITCMVSEILQDDTIIQWVLGNKDRKIELVWTVCVEFIKWYNENK